MADKYFSREEAERLLPVIAPCLERARQDKRLCEDLSTELAVASMRIMALGGSQPPQQILAGKRAERDRLREQVEEAVNKISELGCLIKDLDLGLVDFPSLDGDEEILLCWKLGEERIRFWHGVDEGYAGRKPLEPTGRSGSNQEDDKVQ